MLHVAHSSELLLLENACSQFTPLSTLVHESSEISDAGMNLKGQSQKYIKPEPLRARVQLLHIGQVFKLTLISSPTPVQ